LKSILEEVCKKNCEHDCSRCGGTKVENA